MFPYFMFTPNLIVRPGTNDDVKSDFQGLLILVSLAFRFVPDIKPKEKDQVIPFVTGLLKEGDFFDPGLHHLSVLLFGMALSPVCFFYDMHFCKKTKILSHPFFLFHSQCVSESTFARSCGKNTKGFINSTLKRNKSKMNPVAAQTLQFMCINWLYQQMLFSFQSNIGALIERANTTSRGESYQEAIEFLRSRVLPLYFPANSKSSYDTAAAQRSVQETLCYDYFGKALISFSIPGGKPVEYKESSEYDLHLESTMLHLTTQENDSRRKFDLFSDVMKVSPFLFMIFD